MTGSIITRVEGYFEDDGDGAGRIFYLTHPLTVPMPDGGFYCVPASEAYPFRTDFASIPRVLWRFWPPIGHYLRAAVVHDHMCGDQRYNKGAAHNDRVFRFLMQVEHVKPSTVFFLYWGLRAGSWLGCRTAGGCGMSWSEIRRSSWAVRWARGMIIRYLRSRFTR